jgi:hypothetical protein
MRDLKIQASQGLQTKGGVKATKVKNVGKVVGETIGQAVSQAIGQAWVPFIAPAIETLIDIIF